MAQSTTISSNDVWDEDGKLFIIKAGASVIFIIITQTLIVMLSCSSCHDYRKIQELQNPKKKKKSRKSKKSIQSIFKKWRKKMRKSKNKKKTNRSISPAPSPMNSPMPLKGKKRAHLMGTKYEKSGEKERKKMKEKMKYEMATKQIQFMALKQKSQYAMILSGKFKPRGPIRVSTTTATANDFMAEVFDDLKEVGIDKVIIDKSGLCVYDVGFGTDVVEMGQSGKGKSSKGGSSTILTASIKETSMKRF